MTLRRTYDQAVERYRSECERAQHVLAANLPLISRLRSEIHRRQSDMTHDTYEAVQTANRLASESGAIISRAMIDLNRAKDALSEATSLAEGGDYED